jgi:uncharacterized protein (TIGR03435 family)
MLPPLLESRLKLKYHHETREMPIYALVVAEPGKRREVAGDCGPHAGGAPVTPDPETLPHGPCGNLFIRPGHLWGEKAAIRQLADALMRVSGRYVMDQTSLAGKYDIDLQYDPGLGLLDAGGPSLLTALEVQLGLKLEERIGPVDMRVIDHVERPRN